MANRLNLIARVLPGKRIRITAPELNEGDLVDVQLTLPQSNGAEKKRSALEIIESLNGHRLFESSQAAGKYLREERDSW